MAAIPASHAGHRVTIGSLRLTSRAVAHGIPAFAVRIETVGRSLVYSGDTAPWPSLTQLAEGCDVLLCEAESAQAPAEGPLCLCVGSRGRRRLGFGARQTVSAVRHSGWPQPWSFLAMDSPAA
jgi:hypothetical protein